MYEGFELVEEDIDFIVVDKEKQVKPHTKPTKIIHHDYEKLLHRNKIMTTQLTNMVYALDNAGITGNNRELWLAAANCVIKCMSDVIIEGEKMLTTNASSTAITTDKP